MYIPVRLEGRMYCDQDIMFGKDVKNSRLVILTAQRSVHTQYKMSKP